MNAGACSTRTSRPGVPDADGAGTSCRGGTPTGPGGASGRGRAPRPRVPRVYPLASRRASQLQAGSSARARTSSSSTEEAALVACASQRALSPPWPRTASSAGAPDDLHPAPSGRAQSRTRAHAARTVASTVSLTSRAPSGPRSMRATTSSRTVRRTACGGAPGAQQPGQLRRHERPRTGFMPEPPRAASDRRRSADHRRSRRRARFRRRGACRPRSAARPASPPRAGWRA